jgi:hypothetical protein
MDLGSIDAHVELRAAGLEKRVGSLSGQPFEKAVGEPRSNRELDGDDPTEGRDCVSLFAIVD